MAIRLKKRDSDMTEGVIWKQLIDFSIPMAIGLLFQMLYNTVDTVVVGQFVGKTALAAVGSTNSIINTVIGLFNGLAIGAGVVVSQLYGAHDFGMLKKAVQTTILGTMILCAVATAVGILAVPALLRIMSVPEDVVPGAQQYLTIYFGGVTGLLLYNIGSGILRAVGDSRRPLFYLIISAVLNVALDLLFVIGLKMGVAGVAWATILAQAISAFLIILSLTRTDAPYGIRWKGIRLYREIVGRIAGIGLPSGIQQALTSFSNVFVQSYIYAFGTNYMAAWSVYNKLDSFILIPIQSIGMASTTFVGQNFGAKNMPRARKGVRTALCLSVGITLCCSAIIMGFSRQLLTLFTDDADVIVLGTKIILLCSPFYFLTCGNQIYGGALRGIGKAKSVMLIMLFSFVAFRQTYLFCNRTFFGGQVVPTVLGYPVGWFMCTFLLTVAYLRSPICKKPNTVEPIVEAAE